MKRSMLIIEFERDAHDDPFFIVKYTFGNLVAEDPESLPRIEGTFYEFENLKTYINARIRELTR